MKTYTESRNQRENEKAVIYSLLRNPKLFDTYADTLHNGLFSYPENKDLFNSIKKISDAGDNIEILKVYAGCDKRSLELKTVNHLINEVANAAYIDDEMEGYINYLTDNWERTFFMQISSQAINMMSSGDSMATAIAWMNKQIEETQRIGDFTKIVETMREVMVNIERRRNNKGELFGTPTGLTDYDRFSNGFQKSDLVIIAGETSQGKTSLAVTAAKNQSTHYNIPIFFISFEMSSDQLAARVLSQRTGISSKEILTDVPGYSELRALNDSIHKMEGSPFYLSDKGSSDISDIVSSIHTAVSKYKVRVVYIDYLQLITTKVKHGTKEEEIATVTRTLKNIAKKLDITVVLVSQLSRGQNPKPTLSRLRGSGQIEEAADVVLFVWRPEYYGIEDIVLNNDDFCPSKGMAHIIIAKGRNIGTFDFIANFTAHTTHFTDRDRDFKMSENVGFENVKDIIKGNTPF